MNRGRSCLLVLSVFLLVGAGPAAAGDGKLEINDQAIAQKNTGNKAKETQKPPQQRRITGLLLPSRSEKVAAIQKRERDKLERSRASGFLAQEMKKETKKTRMEGALVVARPRQDESLPLNAGVSDTGYSFPASLCVLAALLFVAAVTFAGYAVGKKYSHIFKTQRKKK